MRERFQRFMLGRYGFDDLGRFLNIAIIVLLIPSLFYSPLSFLPFALIIYEYFRVFSKNTVARNAENEAYLRIKGKIFGWFSIRKKMFTQRKTHKFFRCPHCKRFVSIPRGKGKITITCTACHEKFPGAT